MMVKSDEDELIEYWMLVGDELGQVAGKRGATRLGFSLLLKFYARPTSSGPSRPQDGQVHSGGVVVCSGGRPQWYVVFTCAGLRRAVRNRPP